MASDSPIEESSTGLKGPIEHFHGVRILAGEEVYYDIRPSWANWVPYAILYAVITAVSSGLGAILFLHLWLIHHNTHYIITNKSIIRKKWLLSSTIVEYEIDQIEDVWTDAGYLEKKLHKGRLHFTTHNGHEVVLRGIPECEKVAERIRSGQA